VRCGVRCAVREGVLEGMMHAESARERHESRLGSLLAGAEGGGGGGSRARARARAGGGSRDEDGRGGGGRGRVEYRELAWAGQTVAVEEEWEREELECIQGVVAQCEETTRAAQRCARLADATLASGSETAQRLAQQSEQIQGTVSGMRELEAATRNAARSSVALTLWGSVRNALFKGGKKKASARAQRDAREAAERARDESRARRKETGGLQKGHARQKDAVAAIVATARRADESGSWTHADLRHVAGAGAAGEAGAGGGPDALYGAMGRHLRREQATQDAALASVSRSLSNLHALGDSMLRELDSQDRHVEKMDRYAAANAGHLLRTNKNVARVAGSRALRKSRREGDDRGGGAMVPRDEKFVFGIAQEYRSAKRMLG